MSNSTSILLAASVFVVVLGVFFLARYLMERYQSRLERRLNGHDGRDAGDSGILVKGARTKPPSGWAERMDSSFERMIQRTGLEVSAAEALGFLCLFGVGLGALLYLWRGQIWLAAFGLLVGAAGILATYLFLQARYRRQLQRQLPDALYLLARSLRAGLSLEQALELVGEEGVKPLSQEFQRIAGQVKLGLSVPAALQSAADRVQLLDFDAFVSTVTIYYGTGGNLALLLDRLAAGARDRLHFRGQFLAATAQGRATAVFIAAAAPFILLLYAIFQPEHIQAFFQSTTGWTILGGALLLEIIGTIWLFKILSINY